MPISREEVEKVAVLARLLLSEEELQKMTRELGAILEYVAQLDRVDTAGVEPMAHALDAHDVFRPDELRPSLARSGLGQCPASRPGVLFGPRRPRRMTLRAEIPERWEVL